MEISEKLEAVQKELSDQRIDGWLFYDFRRSNELACEFLEIPPERLLTRRFFYWLPKQGDPVKLISAIEDNALKHLPGLTIRYRGWEELENAIGSVLHDCQQIAMEYSPRNAIPYVSKVDAGTMEIVQGFDVEVISSADLLQKYTSVWDEDKLKMHIAAAKVLCETIDQTWQWISVNLKADSIINEYNVQQYILKIFEQKHCITEDLPICAVNEHSADPHYIPN